MKKVLGILIALFLVSCGGDQTATETDARAAVPVKAIKIAAQNVGGNSSYSGTVEPLEQVRLSTRLSGWVEAIFAEAGQPVQKGDVLVKLRSKDVQAKLAQAEAGIAAADAQYENAQRNLARIESLFKNKAATQKELDDMRTAFATAEAQRTSAYKMKEEVQEMLRYTRLQTPFSGVVTRKLIDVGDLVNPGQLVMEVENVDKVKITANVPETAVDALKKGMSVNISIGASQSRTDGKTLVGTIDQIVSAADPMSRQFVVKVLVDNPEHAIKSGMFARISIADSENTALLVPEKAVFKRGQLEGIFIVDAQNKARLRWIRSGRKYNGSVEVLSGLNPGDVVIINRPVKLLDGQPVSVSFSSGNNLSGQQTAEVQG